MKIMQWLKMVLLFGMVVFSFIKGYSQNEIKFSRKVLTNDFYAEGVAVADVNKDGKPDVLAGTEWFEAPSWKKHDITKPATFKTTDYSQSFLQYAMDVDQDGWIDLIRIGYPGDPAGWYRNPGKKKGYWKEYSLYPSVGNESPSLLDIDGDGRKDLVCNNSELKKMVWVSPPTTPHDTTWTEHIISSDTLLGTHKYTHGLGFGDMNLDGRIDVLYREGWWEAPADRRQPDWTFHHADLGKECSQMYVMDLDEDGDQDVISSSAHDYGIWWHEQIKNGDSIEWKSHDIFTEFSQSHSLRSEDINGDGHPDLITGKRYYAHNGKDPGAEQPAVIYWFEYKPGKQPQWTPHLIDNNSGAGLNFVVDDMNNDKLPDIVVSNKKGVFVFFSE